MEQLNLMGQIVNRPKPIDKPYNYQNFVAINLL